MLVDFGGMTGWVASCQVWMALRLQVLGPYIVHHRSSSTIPLLDGIPIPISDHLATAGLNHKLAEMEASGAVQGHPASAN